jgi:hypothetical protein
MIDLFFVLFFIPRRVKALAKLRGESWIKWTLWTVGAWLGTEVVTGFVILIMLMTYSEMTNTELNKNLALIIASFMSTASGALAATVVVSRLSKKPLLPTPTEDVS